MKRNRLYCIFFPLFLLWIFPGIAEAQDQGKEVILPAGTLLGCTLNEPNFSSKTAEVGNPVVCALDRLRMFDRIVFPRGGLSGRALGSG